MGGGSGDPFDGPSVLPPINSGNKGSPFKGFLDISIVTQKLRKNMKSQDGTLDPEKLFDFAGPGGKGGR